MKISENHNCSLGKIKRWNYVRLPGLYWTAMDKLEFIDWMLMESKIFLKIKDNYRLSYQPELSFIHTNGSYSYESLIATK